MDAETADCGSGVVIGVGVGSDVELEVGNESPRRREVMYVPVEPGDRGLGSNSIQAPTS